MSEKRDRRVVEETRDGRKMKDGVPPAAPSPTLFCRVSECAIRVKHGFSYLPTLIYLYLTNLILYTAINLLDPARVASRLLRYWAKPIILDTWRNIIGEALLITCVRESSRIGVLT